MIFECKSSLKYILFCLIQLLIFIIGCNRNPIGNDFGEWENLIEKPEQTWSVYAIGQNSDGNMFSIDYQGIFLFLDSSGREEITSFKKSSYERYRCSNCFIKDRNGSLIFSIDTNLMRIVTDGLKYVLDTIGHLSRYATQFEMRYSIDDNKNIWFTDQCDSGVNLLKWDGAILETYPLHIQDTLNSSFDVNSMWIAAGDDTVCILYINAMYENSSGTTTESAVEKKIIVKQWNSIDKRVDSFEKFWPDDKSLETAFFVRNKLFISYNDYSEWHSGMYLMSLFAEEYYEAIPIADNSTYLHVLKQNATTAYLYSETSIIKIAELIAGKDLYSHCSGLFLDTSGAVILYDQTHENFVNISNLPGFRNNP